MSIKKIRESKNKSRLVMLTAFDAITGSMAAAGGVDMILVGDSLGNTSLGLRDTLGVSFQTMLERTRAVVRVAGGVPVIFDMPFLSYGVSEEETVRQCGLAIQETGCQAVKMEGGSWLAPTFSRLIRLGIPVMGHIGLLPQHVNQYGGMFFQGRGEGEAERILADGKALEEAGAFAVVAECVPAGLGRRLQESLTIPVIGIGAGLELDGQVQVISDLLGMQASPPPKHARAFTNLYSMAEKAIREYGDAVRNGSFPGPENCTK